MKHLLIFMAASILAACGASSNASKTETPQVDLAAQLPAVSGDNVWTMDAGESVLQFTAVHNSRDFTGGFSKFASVIKLDPANPSGGEIHVAVDLASVDAGDRDRNANLPNKDWFHVAQYPVAVFSSKDISKSGNGGFLANGELGLKGITKPVTLNFDLVVDGDSAQASGSANLMRNDFGVGQGPDFEAEDWVKFPVAIAFDIKAEK